jgi:protein involved in polysaccharide export with SLBB domain
MIRRSTIFLLFGIALAASGCGRIHPESVAPAPIGDQVVAVKPGDVLQIQVWPQAEMGGDFPVEETGFVYLPVIGRVEAAGRNLSDLRSGLREAFGEIMRTPVVTITPRFRVTVAGAVARPGLQIVDPTVSFYDVITLAGGFTEEAKRNEIFIYREGDIYEFNADNPLRSGDLSAAPSLQSGDRIYIPRQFRISWRELRWTLQLIGTGLTLYRLFTIKL